MGPPFVEGLRISSQPPLISSLVNVQIKVKLEVDARADRNLIVQAVIDRRLVVPNSESVQEFIKFTLDHSGNITAVYDWLKWK